MHRIVLAGEAPLVEEFASAFRAGGLSVILPQSRAASPPRPRGRIDAALELTLPGTDRKASALAALDRLPPGVPLFTNSLVVTVAEQSGRVRNAGRLAGIGAFPGVLGGGLLEFALPAEASTALREAAAALARSLGKEAAFVQDLPGMVLPRIRCMLTNEACFALAEQIASARDIDLAMKLGTNYPSGPLAWGERTGFGSVLAILEALHRWYGEERYRPAPLLRRAAMMGSIAGATGQGGAEKRQTESAIQGSDPSTRKNRSLRVPPEGRVTKDRGQLRK